MNFVLCKARDWSGGMSIDEVSDESVELGIPDFIYTISDERPCEWDLGVHCMSIQIRAGEACIYMLAKPSY